MKLAFLNRFFLKNLHIKFHENPSTRSRVAPCGRTDGEPDLSMRFAILLTRIKTNDRFQVDTLVLMIPVVFLQVPMYHGVILQKTGKFQKIKSVIKNG